jgi:hypothetical protein
MDLGDKPFDQLVEKSRLPGPMPGISHMVIIREISDLTKQVFDLLETSKNRVN